MPVLMWSKPKGVYITVDREGKPLSWRERCAPIIARVLEETRGQPEREIKRALRDAYPWGERAMYPYKAWLLEVKSQRFPKARKRRADPVPEGQGALFDP